MPRATFLGFLAVALTGGVAIASSACGSTSQDLGDNDQANLGPAGPPDSGAPGNVTGDQDSTTKSDGGSTLPEACGSTSCRAGSKCVASECVYDCNGAHVPGDYPTFEAAMNALGDSGGTLCLGPQSYDGASTTLRLGVTIVGVPGKTKLSETTFNGSQGIGVVVQGITFTGDVEVSGAFDMTFENCAFLSKTAGSSEALRFDTGHGDYAAQLRPTIRASSFAPEPVTPQSNYAGLAVVQSSATPVVVDIDASDFHLPHEHGFGIRLEGKGLPNDAFGVKVRNSYFHDSVGGIQFASVTTLQLLNDTFVNNDTALATGSTSVGGAVEYFNDLFVDNKLAMAFTAANPPTLTHGNNLVFGNTANYAGAAGDGPNYLKADPQLDTSAYPPALKPGSPAVHAGNPMHASDHDYWGRPRTDGIDLGAVQN
jgi:hypothetical protein